MQRPLPERLYAQWDTEQELADDGFLMAVTERPEHWFSCVETPDKPEVIGVYRLVEVVELKHGVITSKTIGKAIQ